MSNCRVVTNGCNGACCSAVFFPYTIDELKRIKDAREKGIKWVDDKGIECSTYPTDSIVSHDYLIDMLIPLGWQTKDPETGKQFIQKLRERPEWESVEPTNENLGPGLRLNDNGDVEGFIVTCKHFDAEQRICKDYENRPGLCRKYGAHCKYEGCTCDIKMKENGEVTI